MIPYPLSGKGLCGTAGLPGPTSTPKSGGTMIGEGNFLREMPFLLPFLAQGLDT